MNKYLFHIGEMQSFKIATSEINQNAGLPH